MNIHKDFFALLLLVEVLMEKPLNSIWGWTSFGNPSSDQGISQVRWEVKDIYEKKVVGGGGGG